VPGRPGRRAQRSPAASRRGGGDRAAAAARYRGAQVGRVPASPQSNLGPDPRGEAIVIRTISAFVCLVAVLVGVPMLVRAADPPLIRFGHGFAAEEQAWLMAARADLTPGQGTKYRLKPISFPGNPERFQAYLADDLSGGTAPAL